MAHKMKLWRGKIALIGLLTGILSLLIFSHSIDGYYGQQCFSPCITHMDVSDVWLALNGVSIALLFSGNDQRVDDWQQWLWDNGVELTSVLFSGLALLSGGLIGAWRWQKQWLFEEEKHQDEQFAVIAAGLASDHVEMRTVAAVTLAAFLDSSHKRFAVPAWQLVVPYLQQTKADQGPDLSAQQTFHQALVGVLKKAFPLARSHLGQSGDLVAVAMHLEGAYLEKADFKYVVMPRAFLKGARLNSADLSASDLSEADLQGAQLQKCNLSGASLQGASLEYANLSGANLSDTNLRRANLRRVIFQKKDRTGQCTAGAILCNADLREADLRGVDLCDVDLRGANLDGADIQGADFTRCMME